MDEIKNNTESTSFILKRAVNSDNYLIHRKICKNNNITYERATYVIYGAYIKFGVERYNNNNILNVYITDSNNINYNVIITLNRVVNTFTSMADNEKYKNLYSLTNKKFYPFIKEIENNENVKKYNIRLYIKKCITISHVNNKNVSINMLKNKVCNLDIELGALWINNKTNMYGINLYITHITVLN